MAPPLVTYPDAERLVVDVLTELLDGEDCTVGVGLPDDWSIDRTNPDGSSPPHVQVASDGAVDEHPISQRHTIRLTVWGASTTEVKRLAHLAKGHLHAAAGTGGVSTVSRGTGVLAAFDDDHDADLATCTARVRVRSVSIT